MTPDQKNQSTNNDTKTRFKFPCTIPIKVIGKHNEEFETTVLQIFHAHFPNLKENCLALKTSTKNTYLSMTVSVDADSKDQLDKLYLDLSACSLVLWGL